MIKKYFSYFCGFAAGILNGLFGAGGGMVVVPMLEKDGIEAKKAHATSIAIILPLTVITSFLYLSGGRFVFSDAMLYIPSGIVGAVCGALFLKKIPNDVLRRVFGLVMLWAAVRPFSQAWGLAAVRSSCYT